MVTSGAQNLQPRCRERAEDLAGVVKYKLGSGRGTSPQLAGCILGHPESLVAETLVCTSGTVKVWTLLLRTLTTWHVL
jgi:hypothetical protein